MTDAAENPFASRYVRPGAVPYLFPPGATAESLVARFENLGRRGAIIGPHGAGKSTLLEELLPLLRRDDREARLFVLRDGERRLHDGFDAGLRPSDVLVVDGYEQLGWWGVLLLRSAVERAKCGLLVTSHRAVRRVPTLLQVRTSADTALALVERLTGGLPAGGVTADDVSRLFAEHQGNVREMLFALYDLYESRRS